MPTLHELEPEQLARIGVFYLEEAVLDVLYKVRRDGGGWILPSKVSHQIGVRTSRFVSVDYPLAHAAMESLRCKNKVEYNNEKWRIMDEEFERRRDA